MKKLLICFALMGATVFAAKADYLYWQVTDSMYSQAGLADDSSRYSALYAKYNDQYYMLGSVADTALGTFDTSESRGKSLSPNPIPDWDASGVSYYVELASYDSSTGAWTGKGNYGELSYSQIANVSATALKQVQATWSGMTTYAAGAVPEPTSGLMLLVGMAMLGLKRRRA